jgi:hypothetical protein
MLRLILACVALLLAPGVAWAAACQSNGSGTWSTVGVWINCNGQAPGTGDADSVEVRNGHTVTLDANIGNLTGITVRNGGILQFGNDNTARTLTVGGSITVDNGGILRINGASNTNNHALSLSGDIVNNGTFDMQTDAGSGGNTTFTGTAQTVGGTGATTRFRGITVNMTGATVANIVDVTATAFSMGQAITFTDGTFRLSTPVTLTPTAAWTIPANARFWLNNAGATVTQNANVTLNGGQLRVDAGTLTVGNANNELIALNNLATTLLEINGGTVNVAGRVASAAAAGAGTYLMTGGTLTVGTVGNTTNAANAAPFFLGTASSFQMSNGTIVIRRASTAATPREYDNRATAGSTSVTGGTIQFGDAATPAGQTLQIGSTPALPNVLLNATNNPTVTLATAVSAIGNWTNNATFTNGGFTVTFTGAIAQTLGGSAASTFQSLTLNKSANHLTLACGTPSPTVNGTLTLTAGRILTAGAAPACATACSAQVPLVVGAAGTIAGGSASSYVQGALRKNFNASATINFRGAGDEFPVGDASAYAPVEIVAGTASAVAGNIIACTTATDHPQVMTPPVSTGGIDAARSLNRYWSFAVTGFNTTAVPVNAIFKFVAGDVDSAVPAVDPLIFVVERWNGTAWFPTTQVAAGTTATQTQAQNIGLAVGTNDFAIGEPLAGFTALPGQFNAFDTTTPAGSIIGFVQTKQSGVAFSLRLVRLNAAKNAVDVAYGQAGVTVELLDSADNAGALNAVTACRPIGAAAGQWHVIAGTTQAVNFAAGVVAAVNFTVPNSYRDVRVHVVRAGAGAGEGCSTDRFAIRPQSIAVSAHDTNWESAGTGRSLDNTAVSGGVVHKASEAAAATPRPFTLRATPVPASAALYDGNPTAVSGFPSCATLGALCTAPGTLSFTAGSWTGTGTRENATANYAEAGAFRLQLEDQAYASVDAVDGSSTATRAVPASATVSVGRFVPERFDFTLPGTPQLRTFGSSCASRSFTYVGQLFWYLTGSLPSATVSAVNAAGTVTANYTGTLFKLTAAGITQTYSNNAVGPALDQALLPAPHLSAGSNGAATYTADDPVTPTATANLAYLRSASTPIAPYTANISLSVTASDNAENAANQGIIGTSTPQAFDGGGGGIAFDSGTEFRYGQARLANASGPGNIDVPIALRMEYHTGTGFAVNVADHCSAFVPKNFVLSGHNPAGFSGSMVTPSAGSDGNVSISGNVAAGVANLRLLKPSPAFASPATVRICLDLDIAAGGDTSCQAVTPANKLHLQGRWSGANYDKDPGATATFGLFGQPRNFIFFRENY